MTWLSSFAHSGQLLGLSLMVGGMLALGAFTAPVIFHQFPRPEAGAAMAIIFRRYDTVLLIALAMLISGELYRIIHHGGFASILRSGWLSTFRLGALVLLSALTLISTQTVNAKLYALQPTLSSAQNPQQQQQSFDTLHTLSETLYKGQLLAAVLVLLLQPAGSKNLD
jgi:hypothetical protein